VEMVDDGGMLEFTIHPTEFLVDFGGQLGVFIQNQGPFSTSITRTGGPCQQPIVVVQDPWMELLKREAYDDTLILLGEAGPRHLAGSLGPDGLMMFRGAGGEAKIPLHIKMFHVDDQEVQ